MESFIAIRFRNSLFEEIPRMEIFFSIIVSIANLR